jgi:hypothetical protein
VQLRGLQSELGESGGDKWWGLMAWRVNGPRHRELVPPRAGRLHRSGAGWADLTDEPEPLTQPADTLMSSNVVEHRELVADRIVCAVSIGERLAHGRTCSSH